MRNCATPQTQNSNWQKVRDTKLRLAESHFTEWCGLVLLIWQYLSVMWTSHVPHFRLQHGTGTNSAFFS
jgi:hypothetical protein